MKNESLQVRLPDIEVIVRAAAYDVAVLAFYQDEDNENQFDVLTGIADEAEVSVVVATLQEAIKALHAARWRAMADVGDEPIERNGTPS